MDAVESIKQKRRHELEPLHLYKSEQNFLADLMCAIPHNWSEAENATEIGEKVLEVLDRHMVGSRDKTRTDVLYDLFHRSGENK